jgi:hypothetical protein
MTTFLELFRQGYDTAQIAAMTGESEAVVYNMMTRERVAANPIPKHEIKRRQLHAYWNGTDA